MKFRSVLLAWMVTLIVGILLAAGVAIFAVINRSARESVSEDLQRTRQVLDDLQGYRRALFRAQCQVVADEPRLKAVVASEEVSKTTVLGVAEEIRRALKSDLFVLTDREGGLIADSRHPEQNGGDLKSNQAIADALKNGAAAATWIDGTEAYQVEVRRLNFGATPVGVLALGYRLDDRVAQTVYRQTGTSVVVFLEGRVIAASPLEGDPSPDLVGEALKLFSTADQSAELNVGGQRYLAAAAPFPGEAKSLRFVLLRSLDVATAPSRHLIRILFAVLGAGVLAALALAWALSSRLSRPLQSLVAFTQEVSAGRLNTRATPGGPQEVRALGQAMNQMVIELEGTRRHLTEKNRLEREMEIASTIQTSLLPRAPEVVGLRISAAMEPASEVGGDYYDVLPTSDGAWLAIGDVAGHGLSAGMVMLMLQNAMASVVRARPDATPREAITVLNGVLFENIRHRLRRDEHVTCSLLRYHRDGRIVFAGAHEDILVLRAATGRCERIPTSGTWIGAVRDVSNVMPETEFRLAHGDRVLLYTDGLTEAMNAAREQFGMDRVCEILETGRAEPLDAVRDQLLLAVRAWWTLQADDVTLLLFEYRSPAANPT